MNSVLPPTAPPKPHWMSVWLIHYAAAAAARHIATGIAVLGWPYLFQASTAFDPMVVYSTLSWWGVAYLATGLFVVAGLTLHRINLTRWGMIVSATVNVLTLFAITWGVVTSWVTADSDASPFVPIILAAITYKDFTVIRNPLNDPLSDYLEEVDLDAAT